MPARRSILRNLIIPLGLLILALASRFWLAPRFIQLSRDYFNETYYAIDDQFRQALDQPWTSTELNSRRTDQAIAYSGDALIMQGSLQVYDPAGKVIFETTAIYGLDPKTRANFAEYGDLPRTGQYFFPADVEKSAYELWDPHYIGSRQAVFERQDVLDGVEAYVFGFSGTDMDETSGYASLPGVPENYRVLTDGEGKLWVEPTSGVMVDFEEHGVSYLVEPGTGEHLGEFHRWQGRLSDDSRQMQLHLAKSQRLRTQFLRFWFPVATTLLAAAWCLVAFWFKPAYFSPLTPYLREEGQ